MWVKLNSNNYFNVDNGSEWVYNDRERYWEFYHGACFDPVKTVSKEKFEIILRAMFREKECLCKTY